MDAVIITNEVAGMLLQRMEGRSSSEVLQLFRDFLGRNHLWDEDFCVVQSVMTSFVSIDCYSAKWCWGGHINSLLALILYSRGDMGEEFEIELRDFTPSQNLEWFLEGNLHRLDAESWMAYVGCDREVPRAA